MTPHVKYEASEELRCCVEFSILLYELSMKFKPTETNCVSRVGRGYPAIYQP